MTPGIVPILQLEQNYDDDNDDSHESNQNSGQRSVTITPAEKSGDDYFSLSPGDGNTDQNQASLSTGRQQQRPSLISRLSSEGPSISIYRGSYIKSSGSLRSHWNDSSGHSESNSGPGNHGHSSSHHHHNHHHHQQHHLSHLSHSAISGPDSLHPHSRPASVRSDPRASLSQVRMGRILSKDTEFRDRYDLEELREGFFDAIFVPPTAIEENYRQAIEQKRLPEQQPEDRDRLTVRLERALVDGLRQVFFSRRGLALLRASVAYLICYILCVIPAVKGWFGRYSYFAPWAAILHHSGRSIGSQLEITLDSVVGMALGLGWSSLALYISTATKASQHGFGGIHACSLIVALWITSWIRAHFIRMYHGLITCALSLIFMETVLISERVYWKKAFQFGIPYLFGLVVPLVVSLVVFPDSGHMAIMEELQATLRECQKVVQFCGGRDKEQRKMARNELTVKSLEFSRAFREMSNEITISTMSSRQMLDIRNSLQSAVTRYRSIPKPATLFSKEAIEPDSPVEFLRSNFGTSAKNLIHSIVKCLDECIFYVEYLKTGDKKNYTSTNLEQRLEKLDAAIESLGAAYHKTVKQEKIFKQASTNHEMLDIMLYVHYLYEASKATHRLAKEFEQLQSTKMPKRKWQFSRPIYPFMRGLYRTTAQITHDRGGESAAYYYQAKKEVEASFKAIEKLNYQYFINPESNNNNNSSTRNTDNYKSEKEEIQDAKGWRYKTWWLMHKMQGYESRFAVKASITLTLVSLPAWVNTSSSSTSWYTKYDSWFAAMMACVALHPRVGGNAKDFVTRSIFCFMGSVWGGIVARTYNSYAMVVLGMLFMLPCLYRFIITSHPRSGLVGCASFTLVSLSIEPGDNIFKMTWTRFLAIEVGLASAFVVSWVFWPFVARHEVRKSTAIVLSQISQCYQIVTDRYLYKNEDEELPTLALQLGEIREARMLQNLRALEQLIEMTEHEPTLRGDFDSSPYQALLHSCQYVFQKIADARISSIYFNVFESDANRSVTRQLVSLRRDNAASVIFVFYILANSFRSKHKVPRFLPSAAMSRKLLFDSLAELAEAAHADANSNSNDTAAGDKTKEHRIWQMVHEAAFSRAFTDITEELEKMIAYSKYILGEERI